MIHFFGNKDSKVYAVQTTKELTATTVSKLTWLFANQPKIEETSIDTFFVGYIFTSFYINIMSKV